MAVGKGKVCLAYSGGLDTSTILVWLLEQGYEVVCYLADVGQQEDWDDVKAKAKKLGATSMLIDDQRQCFVDELALRAVQCNAIYEGRYLLGTSLARPVIARGMMKYAIAEGCQFVSHGCTGKGNDQVRFELAFLAIDPKIKIITPWRDPAFFNRFQGRQDLLAYAAEKNIPVVSTSAKPWSMDANLAHCSYEAGILEEPSLPPPNDVWTMTDDPETAPDKSEQITIEWEKGLPVKLTTHDKKTVTGSLAIWIKLNELGKKHGIGRIDIVEQRFIGVKSRGCYDAPAHTILRSAHLDLEGLCLDGRLRSLRDQFVTHNWSELIYNGLYFSPEREWIEGSLISSQERVTGSTTMKLYKGNAWPIARSSPNSLYDAEEASMDSVTNFSPEATSGFIKINSIRLCKYGQAKISEGKPLGDS